MFYPNGAPQKQVVIRLVTDESMISRIIRGAEMGFEWSHCEALTPDGKLLGAHADGGIEARDGDYDKDTWTAQVYISIPVTEAQHKYFYGYLTAQVGKPYDMEAIADMAEGVLTTTQGDDWDRSRFICSALIGSALQVANIPKTPFWRPRLVTPRDIYVAAGMLVAIPPPEYRKVAA